MSDVASNLERALMQDTAFRRAVEQEAQLRDLRIAIDDQFELITEVSRAAIRLKDFIRAAMDQDDLPGHIHALLSTALNSTKPLPDMYRGRK